MTQTGTDLTALGNVPADYRHSPKLITPGEDLALPAAHLKWYDVRVPDTEVPADVAGRARAFLQEENAAGRLAIDGELGFTILHRCGVSFYFLLACTWRNANELWESVHTLDAASEQEFRPVQQGSHLEVVCVWELGTVLHEQPAWIRYLYSARDEAAKQAWLADRFTGAV